MRLFFALWPALATARQWQDASADALAVLGGKPLPAEQLHLTLAFLGEQSADRLPALMALADDLPKAAIDLRFPRLECWRQPGIICLRPESTPSDLTRLVGQLHTGLQLAGMALPSRRYKPHVTLSRQLRQNAPDWPLWPVPVWQATTLALVRSDLGADGARYRLLREWPLTS